MAGNEPPALAEVVDISYEELMATEVDLSVKLELAYGLNGNGIATVSNVPGYPELRKRLLHLAHRFANLPEEVKRKVEDRDSFYSYGWSHGKEKLEGGRSDFLKGSYYANPIHDQPTTDEDLIKKYPAYCRPNIWPREDLPELEAAFKQLGEAIVNVGRLLTVHFDKYVISKNPLAEPGKLQRILERSKCYKGRLLHYFPLQSDSVSSPADMSTWCGWHYDHGSLTGLTRELYTNSCGEEIANPDSRSGLYIRNRSGTTMKAIFSADRIAFQMGETMQIHSGGLLRATLHCVRAAEGDAAVGVARNTFALFMQPQWDEPMNLPPGSPPPQDVGVAKWEPGMDFYKFSDKTFAANYS